MNQVSKSQPASEDTEDPLIVLFRQISAEAKAAGLTEAEIDAELALHKAQRSV